MATNFKYQSKTNDNIKNKYFSNLICLINFQTDLTMQKGIYNKKQETYLNILFKNIITINYLTECKEIYFLLY